VKVTRVSSRYFYLTVKMWPLRETETEAEGKPAAARFLAAMIGSGRQYLLNRCGVSRRGTF